MSSIINEFSILFYLNSIYERNGQGYICHRYISIHHIECLAHAQVTISLDKVSDGDLLHTDI